MRIHSDTLTAAMIHEAVPSSAYVGKISAHGSRSRAQAFEVNLGGSGRMGGQWGQTDGQAATWDEWGMFLAALFALDPEMTVPAAYPTREAFTWMTGGRFDTLTPQGQHKTHRWELQGTAATGSYYVHACKGSKAHPCTAIARRPAYGYTLADVLDIYAA